MCVCRYRFSISSTPEKIFAVSTMTWEVREKPSEQSPLPATTSTGVGASSVRCADWLWSEVLWHFSKKEFDLLRVGFQSFIRSRCKWRTRSSSYWIRRRFAEITVNTVCAAASNCAVIQEIEQKEDLSAPCTNVPLLGVCVCVHGTPRVGKKTKSIWIIQRRYLRRRRIRSPRRRSTTVSSSNTRERLCRNAPNL